jgi:hypothetical protein
VNEVEILKMKCFQNAKILWMTWKVVIVGVMKVMFISCEEGIPEVICDCDNFVSLV